MTGCSTVVPLGNSVLLATFTEHVLLLASNDWMTPGSEVQTCLSCELTTVSMVELIDGVILDFLAVVFSNPYTIPRITRENYLFGSVCLSLEVRQVDLDTNTWLGCRV